MKFKKLLAQTAPALAGIALFFCLLFATGILPKSIARRSAQSYVDEHYAKMDLTYQRVSFDSHRDAYYVTYTDEQNRVYNFYLTTKWIPGQVLYDPLNPPK